MRKLSFSVLLLASAGILVGCTSDNTLCTTGDCGYTTTATYVPTTTYVKKTMYVPKTTYVATTSYVPATTYTSTSNCCSVNCCPTCNRCGFDYGYSSYDLGWY